MIKNINETIHETFEHERSLHRPLELAREQPRQLRMSKCG
jgi:hypothetical protein